MTAYDTDGDEEDLHDRIDRIALSQMRRMRQTPSALTPPPRPAPEGPRVIEWSAYLARQLTAADLQDLRSGAATLGAPVDPATVMLGQHEAEQAERVASGQVREIAWSDYVGRRLSRQDIADLKSGTATLSSPDGG